MTDFTKSPLDTVASKMMANCEELMNKEIASFEAIEMSSEKRAFIEKHIELYWMGSLSKVIRANYYGMKRKNIPMYPNYSELWQNIHEKYPLSENMTPSYFLSNYFDLYDGHETDGIRRKCH